MCLFVHSMTFVSFVYDEQNEPNEQCSYARSLTSLALGVYTTDLFDQPDQPHFIHLT